MISVYMCYHYIRNQDYIYIYTTIDNDVILFSVGPVTIDEYLLRIGCIQLVT